MPLSEKLTIATGEGIQPILILHIMILTQMVFSEKIAIAENIWCLNFGFKNFCC